MNSHFTHVHFLDASCDLCSSDWIAFGNNFYCVFKENTKTWAESQSACEELNSHLVIIDSKAEVVSHTLLFLFLFVTSGTGNTGHEDQNLTDWMFWRSCDTCSCRFTIILSENIGRDLQPSKAGCYKTSSWHILRSSTQSWSSGRKRHFTQHCNDFL